MFKAMPLRYDEERIYAPGNAPDCKSDLSGGSVSACETGPLYLFMIATIPI